VRFARAGDAVASKLRKMILSGELKDGDELPRQEDLTRMFAVSHPSLREGLRALEAEGLVVTRRGRVGGAVIRVPKASGVAYSLGLVLQAEGLSQHDLATALDELEPACFSLAALRPDRADVLRDPLLASCDELEACGDDPLQFTSIARAFHELVVEHCGNGTVRITVGALTRLWSSYEERTVGAGQLAVGPAISEAERREVIVTHRRLTQLIVDGRSEECRQLAAKHLRASQHYVLGPDADVSIDVSDLPFRD
jgi:DNA-binding FadR family transcriptional regulator